jgi:hypothetical protein
VLFLLTNTVFAAILRSSQGNTFLEMRIYFFSGGRMGPSGVTVTRYRGRRGIKKSSETKGTDQPSNEGPLAAGIPPDIPSIHENQPLLEPPDPAEALRHTHVEQERQQQKRIDDEVLLAEAHLRLALLLRQKRRTLDRIDVIKRHEKAILQIVNRENAPHMIEMFGRVRDELDDAQAVHWQPVAQRLFPCVIAHGYTFATVSRIQASNSHAVFIASVIGGLEWVTQYIWPTHAALAEGQTVLVPRPAPRPHKEWIQGCTVLHNSTPIVVHPDFLK